MQQTRLYFNDSHARARKAMGAMEILMDEEGHSLSCHELDYKNDIWQVSAYVPLGEADVWKARLEALLEGHVLKGEAVPDRDWVAATLRDLPAIRAGRFVVHGSHENSVAKAHETAIHIDAGLAFGTGHHGTTAGCLEAFDYLLRGKNFKRIADLGTGSGVLAIAAAKALRRQVIATDIDPVAVRVARANVRQNGVGHLVKCAVAPGTRHRLLRASKPYDLIFANILARPLERMAKDISIVCDRDATLILSGLLPHQRTRLLSVFRMQGFAHWQSHYQQGWLTLILRRG